MRRARILDERMNDSKSAVQDVLQAFSWAPDREDVREALVALAAKARAWNDVIAVDSALAERAQTAQKRVELLRRKAQVIEEQLKDAPRAFRTHLVALLLLPDDADTASHLWRLARVIGKYREADKTPQAEPPPATIHLEGAIAEAVAVSGRASQSGPMAAPPLPGVDPPRAKTPSSQPISTRVPQRAQTEPLADDDLDLSVGDSTQPIDITEVEMAAARERAQPKSEFTKEASTMALSQTDLRGMMVPPRLPPGAGAETAAATAADRSRAVPAQPRRHRARLSVRRLPMPTLPNRPFESPWKSSRWRTSLPAPIQRCACAGSIASEVWETGGKDIARAFVHCARVQRRRASHHRKGKATARCARGSIASRRSTRRGTASPISTKAWRRTPKRRRPPRISSWRSRTFAPSRRSRAMPKRSCAASSACCRTIRSRARGSKCCTAPKVAGWSSRPRSKNAPIRVSARRRRRPSARSC
jgi:hypothetical protein